MDRRDFIKNSLFVLGGASLVCGEGLFCNIYQDETSYHGVRFKKEHLIEKYKNKDELPRKIRIDACTLCQLNCPCCMRNAKPEDFKSGCGLGYLSFKNFKKLVDDNNFEAIELSNMGEIFLNPELLEIIKYSYEKNIVLSAGTGVNLNYLTDEMAEALVKYKIYDITVSIDGATPETYSIYRKGGDFNTVINNVKKINFYKKKYKSESPYLTYKFIVFGHNEHEINKAKALANELNMDMRFAVNYYPTYSPVKNISLIEKQTGLKYYPALNQGVVEDYKKDHNQWLYCKQLWAQPQINWDGKVLGCCCNFYDGSGGNVFKDGLLKALNNPKMIYTKNMLAGLAKPMTGIPCLRCETFPFLQSLNVTVKPKVRGTDITF